MQLSPAKINLGLKVLFRRPDGYHELQSVFLKLSWGDSLRFQWEPSSAFSFHLVSKNLLQGKRFEEFEAVSERGDLSRNILFRAFHFLKDRLPEPGKLFCSLHKRIPTGGGIGGGSSNAGSLLRFLHPLLTSPPSLPEVAQKLGADVPVFLQEGAFLVEGIGEKLTRLTVAPGFGVLALPPVFLPTREMFLGLQKGLREPPLSKPWKDLGDQVLTSLRSGAWNQLQENWSNDFERVAFARVPELGDLKQGFLEEGAHYSSLSGSGSCLYGLVPTEPQAEELLSRMRLRFPGLDMVTFSF